MPILATSPSLPSVALTPSINSQKYEAEDGNYDKLDTDESTLELRHRGTNGEFARSHEKQTGLPSVQWQTWLLETLEEHRNFIRQDIASQFLSFRRDAPFDGALESSDWERPIGTPLVMETQDTVDITPREGTHSEAATTATFPASGRHLPLRRATNHQVTLKAEDLADVKRIAQSIVDKEEQNGARSKSEEKLRYEISAVLGMKNIDDIHPRLDVMIAVVIILNVVSMMFELEWESYKSQVLLGWADDTNEWPNAKTWFKIVDHIFNATFVLECCYRLYLDGWSYFHYKLNCVDFTLVFTASLQIYVLEPWGAATGEKLTLFRLVRFIRFIRILKVMKLKAFADLRVLVKTCISSLAALLWSMVLLFLIIIMSGLFLCSLLKTSIQDIAVDRGTRVWLYRHYGSSARASYTLFEVTLAGCWPTYFRPLIEEISVYYGIFAVFYITLVVFAVIRIITAIFLKQTLQVASSDAEMMVNEQRIQTQRNAEKLKGVFRAIDVSGKGVLTFDDFMRVAVNPDVRAWLQNFELAVHDVEGLFCLLDDGDGEITYDEFIQGIMRLKGQARSLDVVAISRHCDKIEDAIGKIGVNVDHLLTTSQHESGHHSSRRISPH